MILPVSFWVASLALGQSYDCPSASEATLKDMGEYVTRIHTKNYIYVCIARTTQNMSMYAYSMD